MNLFLDFYHDSLRDPSDASLHDETVRNLYEQGSESVLEMARMHIMIMKIVERYVELGEILPLREREISEGERMRIVRGLYRFQVFVELFGDVRRSGKDCEGDRGTDCEGEESVRKGEGGRDKDSGKGAFVRLSPNGNTGVRNARVGSEFLVWWKAWVRFVFLDSCFASLCFYVPFF